MRKPGADLIAIDRKVKNLLSKAVDGESKMTTSVTGAEINNSAEVEKMWLVGVVSSDKREVRAMENGEERSWRMLPRGEWNIDQARQLLYQQVGPY